MASRPTQSYLRLKQFADLVGQTVLVNGENVVAVTEQLSGLADNLEGEDLLLDLRDVRLVSPLIWSVLLRLRRRMASRGKRLCLCNVGPEISEVLEATKLNRVFDVLGSEPSALLPEASTTISSGSC